MKWRYAIFLLLYEVLLLNRFCDSAPVDVEDVAHFGQNHSETLSPTEHVRKDSGIYPELPKYIIDVILPGGLPYGKQKDVLCIVFTLILVNFTNRFASDAIDSLLRIILSYFGNRPYTATLSLKDLLELNLDLPYVLSIGSVITRHWHIFVNEVAMCACLTSS